MDTSDQHALPSQKPLAWLPWMVVFGGVSILYVPTFWDLIHNFWGGEQQGHGPIVLCLSIWLIGRRWPQLIQADPANSNSVLAWSLLILSTVLYAIGRSQSILTFEVGSLIGVLAALISLFRGGPGLRLIWFPLLFMSFLIPLPGTVVDALTQPMKIAVSQLATEVLRILNYPVARSGVTMQIAQYRLFVADACAGLHTLFTLEALGLFYLNVVKSSSSLRNISLAILIVPISFLANTIRVISLVLVTFYFGDEAGRGFIHSFAGIVLFLSGLGLLIAVDSLLRIGADGRLKVRWRR